MPLHDIMFGYDWITANLSPPQSSRRDIYVYGSYLGASLAASLALTETKPNEQMAVRGAAVFNGIYNWPTFLPDHPINKVKDSKLFDLLIPDDGGPAFRSMKQQAEYLFREPADLFDPFASPSLFFYSTGMTPPSEFSSSAPPSPLSKAIDALSLGETLTAENLSADVDEKPPRKGYLAFPPRQSDMQIPDMLLLHENPPPPLTFPRRGRRMASSRKKRGENNFATQANELAALMRRSINRLELRERIKSEGEFEGWESEADSRVQVTDVGRCDGDNGLGAHGEEAIKEWLAERMGS